MAPKPPDVPEDREGRIKLPGAPSGGQHALAAELLLFIAVVAMRAVAQYSPAVKKDTLPKDQYGPLFILGNGFVAFFVLALVSARGGVWAKVAAAGGLIIDVALLLKSVSHLQALAAAYEQPHPFTPAKLTAFTPAEAPVPGLSMPQVKSLSKPGGKLSGPSGSPSAGGASASKAMAFAHKNLTAEGLDPSQFGDLVKLWNAESGWRTTARNPSSGATGIPQLNPNSHKIPANWGSYQVQVLWGLRYIKTTYGSISAAWASEQHRGWY